MANMNDARWKLLSDRMELSATAQAPVGLANGLVYRKDVELARATMESKHPPDCLCRVEHPDSLTDYHQAMELLGGAESLTNERHT